MQAARPAGGQSSRPCVFINYRRADAGGWAGRLQVDLERRFGAGRVFRDVAIPPGVDFAQHIEGVLDGCRVVLAMIGPDWATLAGADGRPRLQDPHDLVRAEIERALQRPDVQVIPVLVEGARMPDPASVPAGLVPLLRRNAIELTDPRWDYDVGRLGDTVAGVLGEPAPKARPAPAPAPPSPGPAPRDALGAAVAMVAAGGVATMLAAPGARSLGDARPASPDSARWSGDFVQSVLERVGYYGAERAVLWAVIAAAALAAASLALPRARTAAPAALLAGLGAGALAGLLGGAVLIALKDLATVSSGAVLNGAGLAVTGLVLSASFARLAGGERVPARAAGLAGGALAGLIGYAISGPDPGAAGLALQSVLLLAALAALVAAPSAAPVRPSPAV